MLSKLKNALDDSTPHEFTFASDETICVHVLQLHLRNLVAFIARHDCIECNIAGGNLMSSKNCTFTADTAYLSPGSRQKP